MDPKQKKELQILLDARKRADKVLAERNAKQQDMLDRSEHKAANQALIHQYTLELTARAEKSGILALARQAAEARGGRMSTKLSCYLDFGIHTSRIHRTVMTYKDCVLRASHLSVFINWVEDREKREAEIRFHRNGAITFHHSPLPIYPILWRKVPGVLPKMLAGAMAHPHPPDPGRPKREWA